jgi:hypothetical protein
VGSFFVARRWQIAMSPIPVQAPMDDEAKPVPGLLEYPQATVADSSESSIASQAQQAVSGNAAVSPELPAVIVGDEATPAAGLLECPQATVAETPESRLVPGMQQVVSGNTTVSPRLPAVADSILTPAVGDRILALSPTDVEAVLSGRKTMELRGRCARLGGVWLATGGRVVGRVVIVRSEEISVSEFENSRDRHLWPFARRPKTKKICASWFEQPLRLAVPVDHYRPPKNTSWDRFRRSAEDLVLEPGNAKRLRDRGEDVSPRSKPASPRG